MAKRPPARKPAHRRARQTRRTTSKPPARSRSSRSATPARSRRAAKPAQAKAPASKVPAKRRSSKRTTTAKKAVPRTAKKAAPRATRRRRSPAGDLVLSTPPSSLDLKRRPSAARSGRAEMAHTLAAHTESSPALTAGDVDADWAAAYSSGDEAPGGDMPTPDQGVVEEIGTALGVAYADDEELRGADKIEDRDRQRWELDPASAEDYEGRARDEKRRK